MRAGDRSSLDRQRNRPARSWALLAMLAGFAVSAGEPKHGFSYFGDLKYPRDMPHFDYANPAAPKGGVARMPMIGTFNNLHAFVDKGILAVYLDPRLGGLIYDPLLVQSEDELASYYGSLAESVEVADGLSSVAYTLRDNAYWHDGTPVSVADVLWTFDTIKTRGGASWKSSYSDIVSLEQTGPRSFRFHFRESVEKTPHLVIQTGGFTPLPKHYWGRSGFRGDDPGTAPRERSLPGRRGRSGPQGRPRARGRLLGPRPQYQRRAFQLRPRRGALLLRYERHAASPASRRTRLLPGPGRERLRNRLRLRRVPRGPLQEGNLHHGPVVWHALCRRLQYPQTVVPGHPCPGSPDARVQLRVGEPGLLARRHGTEQLVLRALRPASDG